MQNGTTRHKGNQKETQAGRQAGKQGRQGLGKKDAPSNKGKQEGRQAGRQEGRQDGRQGRQGLGKADTPSNKGRQEGRDTRRQGGRRTHHPTKGNRKEDKVGDRMGDKIWETRSGRQDLGDKLSIKKNKPRKTDTHPTKGIKKEDKLGDKMGDKASGRRTHHPIKWETRYGDKVWWWSRQETGTMAPCLEAYRACSSCPHKSLQKPLPPSFSNSVWWRGPTWLVQLPDDARSRQLPRPSSLRDPSLIFSLRLSVRQTRRGPEAQHHHLYYFVSCYSHAPHGHIWAPSICPLPCYPAAHHCSAVFPRIVQSGVLFASAGLLEVCPAIHFFRVE